MGLVEEIINLRPELHVEPLAGFKDLGQRSVGIEKPGPYERVPSQVAIGPWRRPRKAQGSYHRPVVPVAPDTPNGVPAATLGQPAETPDVGLGLKPGFKLGRSATHLSPLKDVLDPTRPVNGSPVRNVPIPFSSHPPNIHPMAFCWNLNGTG
jgi:hypothetical protein